jgi:hypothetical protein
MRKTKVSLVFFMEYRTTFQEFIDKRSKSKLVRFATAASVCANFPLSLGDGDKRNGLLLPIVAVRGHSS